ncbi:hypothetical protein [Candidatus Tisiphia endosymbiont of Nemotelus uliginosus]|uniref:hypothetical protein n=1 Tax=Candidatus Tisiphia endosymbiont of Nemotelus uliginosus TaxID=3077926 RepID=UPI0035C8AFEA
MPEKIEDTIKPQLTNDEIEAVTKYLLPPSGREHLIKASEERNRPKLGEGFREYKRLKDLNKAKEAEKWNPTNSKWRERADKTSDRDAAKKLAYNIAAAGYNIEQERKRLIQQYPELPKIFERSKKNEAKIEKAFREWEGKNPDLKAKVRKVEDKNSEQFTEIKVILEKVVGALTKEPEMQQAIDNADFNQFMKKASSKLTGLVTFKPNVGFDQFMENAKAQLKELETRQEARNIVKTTGVAKLIQAVKGKGSLLPTIPSFLKRNKSSSITR